MKQWVLVHLFGARQGLDGSILTFLCEPQLHHFAKPAKSAHTVSNQTSTTFKMKKMLFNLSDRCTFIDLYVNEHTFFSEMSIFEVFSHWMALVQHHKEDLLKASCLCAGWGHRLCFKMILIVWFAMLLENPANIHWEELQLVDVTERIVVSTTVNCCIEFCYFFTAQRGAWAHQSIATILNEWSTRRPSAYASAPNGLWLHGKRPFIPIDFPFSSDLIK